MKKTKIAGKKLTLNKETLRALQPDELDQVAGGTFTTYPSLFCSLVCPKIPPIITVTASWACH